MSNKATATRDLIRGGKKQGKIATEAAEPQHEGGASIDRTALASIVLLFLSGVAALIYQILWTKQLTLIVGIEVYSITVAVSSFFAGLALGGVLLGRLADRFEKPFLLYAILEAGASVLGIATTYLLAHTAALFAVIETKVGILAWVIPFVLVGAPAFLMGGTLPVAVRACKPVRSRIAGVGGNGYAANTVGGIAGVMLSAFVFLPLFGVPGTAHVAAAINLIAAIGALFLSRRTQKSQQKIEQVAQQNIPKKVKAALVLYALAGGVALGYEVVWSQVIVQFLSTRSFAFAIVLATYLIGLATGSALYARFANRISDSWGVFGFLISVAGLVALLEIAGLSAWQLHVQAAFGSLVFSITNNGLAAMCARFLIAAFGIVFIPTVLLGAAFPVALRLVAREQWIGRDVGAIVALNTAGGIAGMLVTGFLLIPVLGLVRTLAVLAICAAAIGIFAVLRGTEVRERMQWVVFSIGLFVVIAGMLTPTDRLGRLLASTRGGDGSMVFYEESSGGTVAVLRQRSGENLFRRLYIQGVSNSGDAMPSLRYMRLQALLPLMIHTGEPHSALVIGFGTGITAGALLEYPQLQKRVCAELLTAVVHAGSFFSGNFNAASDPKLQIRLRDGRRELVQSSERYDLITLEPPPPSAAGVVNLYSRDFYALAATRLETNGLLAQWLPLTTQNDADTRSLVKSFLDVFPYATLWTTELHEMLLIGSRSPIELDAQQIMSRFSQADVASTLQEVGIETPAALLATWVMGRNELQRYAGNALAVTDDHPRIEYAGWVHPAEIRYVLPELLALRTSAPVHGADAAFLLEIGQQRDNLLGFYAAGIAAYNGNKDLWAQTIVKVLKSDNDNPYYRWALGSDQ